MKAQYHKNEVSPVARTSKQNASVLLFSSSAVTSLAFARSLARKGVDIYLITESRNEATYSKYFKQNFIIPDIETDSKKQIDFLLRFQKDHPFSVIFPGSDNFCLSLSAVEEKMDSGTRERFHFVMPKKRIAETLLNKRRFYQSLSGQGISYPHTYFPESIEDVKRIGHEVGYPVFVKPSFSQTFGKVFHMKGFVAKSKEELTQYWKLAGRHKMDVFLQEIILGSDNEIFGVNAYFDRKHSPRGLFAYRRIRAWPHGFAVGCLVESIPLSSMPRVKAVVDYLSNLGFHGLADAEFKRDPRDGQLKFLEVNPRLWVQSSLPAKCGINLDLMAYLDAIGVQKTSAGSYKSGAKWINPLYDLRSVMQSLRDRELPFSRLSCSLRGVRDFAFSPVDDLLSGILNPLFSLREYAQRRVARSLAMDVNATWN